MEQTNARQGMRRTEIRTVLRRHKGSVVQIARDLGVSHASVSMFLAGRSKSARIAVAAEKLANELLTNEREAPMATR